jgi:hypothetical protein
VIARAAALLFVSACLFGLGYVVGARASDTARGDVAMVALESFERGYGIAMRTWRCAP